MLEVSQRVNRLFLKRLRLLGTVEGISTLVLFGIAMPLKYLAGMPMAVTVVGSIHGFLFLSLATMFVVGTKKIPISRGLAGAGIVAAVLPFGPFVMDRRLEAIQHSTFNIQKF
jgi:integral membrane protein